MTLPKLLCTEQSSLTQSFAMTTSRLIIRYSSIRYSSHTRTRKTSRLAMQSNLSDLRNECDECMCTHSTDPRRLWWQSCSQLQATRLLAALQAAGARPLPCPALPFPSLPCPALQCTLYIVVLDCCECMTPSSPDTASPLLHVNVLVLLLAACHCYGVAWRGVQGSTPKLTSPTP